MRVEEANGRKKKAIRRVEEVKAKAIRVVEIWRESPEFDALPQDPYVVALEEIVEHIQKKERLELDVAFLVDSLEEQKEELQRLSRETGVQISPIAEDIDDGASAS